jgi:hypothetical protein
VSWDQFFTTTSNNLQPIAIGLGLFFGSFVIRRKNDWWLGVRALVMLAAGICMLPLMWAFLSAVAANSKHTAWLQMFFQWCADRTSTWGSIFGFFHMLFALLAGDGLPWILAIVLGIWLVLDLRPRLAAFRSSNGGPGRNGGPGSGSGGIGTRLAALHEADEHTSWVALFLPAVIVLLPPVAAALHMPMGG